MTTTKPRTALPIVFGNMTIGKAGMEGIRVSSLEVANNMLDIFQAHGHNEIDTARVYGGGSSEEFMAAAQWQKRGLVMDTKLYPNEGKGMNISDSVYSHRPEDVRRGLMESLKALDTGKVDMWYLHGPDRKVSLEDTLCEVNKLHNEGFFDRLGVSNYMAWEVAAMCEICDRHGWVKPSVYQGAYNALQRSVEPELFPCLRRYNMSFYAFNPLAGGFLTSRYRRGMGREEFESGSRFDPERWQGKMYQGRYMNDQYFDALDILHAGIKENGLTEAECALRWLEHHSCLDNAKGDKIIIGASSVGQLQQNLADLEKGPLPEDVVQTLDDAWMRCKAAAPKYFH